VTTCCSAVVAGHDAGRAVSLRYGRISVITIWSVGSAQLDLHVPELSMSSRWPMVMLVNVRSRVDGYLKSSAVLAIDELDGCRGRISYAPSVINSLRCAIPKGCQPFVSVVGPLLAVPGVISPVS
jgi:hypothetical protein